MGADAQACFGIRELPVAFVYTHVMGVGTARRTTPFERTHACIYEFIEWLAEARVSASPDLKAAQDAFDAIWKTSAPHDSPYVADYRTLADTIIEGLIRAGAGRRFREASLRSPSTTAMER